MISTDTFGNRCVIAMAEEVDEQEYLSAHSAQARCGGKPPVDLLQCYPLCIDCDLLHQRGDRSLFSRLAMLATETQAIVSDRYESLELGYAAIRKMLERLSLGDPDARVILPDDIGLFRELEPLLNSMASFLKGQVDDSHEVAIGLCEHYETLLQLAGGNLASRASTASPVELIAKLGELINRQAEKFCETIGRLNTKEQELLSLSRRQQDVIDFLPDATFVIDREHRVIAWNKAMAELTGVSGADILGKGDYAYSQAFYGHKRPLLIDFIGADLEDARRYYGKLEKRGTVLIAEGDLVYSDTIGARALWITASPLFDQGGDIIGAIESVRDISNLKHAEAEREVLKDQLHHSQKLDSIGQLAGGIAHEFNNILAAILGYAGMLEMHMERDSAHLDAVKKIICASEKASSLTRSMLTFSRKQVVTLEPVSLNSFITGMKQMLTRLAGENINIQIQLDPHEIIVNADLGQLQQVILNLYNNARDAMPDGGELIISTAGRTIDGFEDDVPHGIPAGSYVQLTVGDTGQGITADNLGLIFDPFFTTKEVGKGTGLGLSMVFGIVRQHGGYLKVSSEVGKGTTMSVWFPELLAEVRSVSENGEPGSAVVTKSSATILVGEDNEDVRPMIVELLQDVGYQVLEGCDGAEVVRLMEDFGETVDLLLMDVIMPRMNGYEALTLVRQRYPEVPCVFLSGYSDDILKQKAKITGEFEYLCKPIMPDKLLAAVRTALSGAAKPE
jgi:PAS domain S-box-containing protein